MRKLFTLALAVLASASMWAQEEIIKVELSGDKGSTQTVTGTIGGTCAVNSLGSSAPYKLNSNGAYVALTLTSGNFEARDLVTITGADKAHQIYYGEAGSGTFLCTTASPSSGIITCTLKGLPEGQNTIYVYRSSSSYNGKLTTMAVSRPAPLPETGDGDIIYTMSKGSAVVSGDETVGHLSANFSEIATSTLAVESSDAKDSYCGRITGQTVDFSEDNYVQLGFTVADGYIFKPSAASIALQANTDAMKAKVVIADDATTIESDELALANGSDVDAAFAADAFNGKKLEGNVTITIYFWGIASKRAYIKSPLTISGTVELGCTPPSEQVVLTLDTTKNQGEGLYVGDKVKFNISGAGSGADITITGKNDETITANEWTAVIGEHTFILNQEDKDNICGITKEIKLVVAGTDKVESAVVSGPSGTYLGKETTLTCTAENATDYQWYKGGTKIDGATSAEYSFTPDAVGDLVFYCEAWNKFNNGTPVKSADFAVTVTEGVCGVLAELKVTGEKTGTLSGEFTGTPSVSVDKNGVDYEGQTGYKLKAQDSHVGFTLTDGTLKAKDKVIVYVTKVSDGKKLQIFSDKGNTLIAETEDLVLGANTFVLGDDAEDATGVFVYRVLGGTEGAQYNAYIASVTLKRPCGEESSDATLKSLTVGEDEIELVEGKFDYEYEVPADYTDAEFAIAFELNDAKATADKKSPLQTLVPDAGNSIEVAINVTAEDGTKATYTITITKPEEAKSDDASIKELKIENEVITAVNDTFSYEVPAEANLSDASVEFVLNHENATASKKSPFLVKVPASGEAATEEELVVTAEDEITIKTYIISVSRAAEEQGLWDVQGDKVQSTKVLRDGQMYILRGEKTYTIVGAEMK